jgi:hypothetical protein
MHQHINGKIIFPKGFSLGSRFRPLTSIGRSH